MKEYSLIQLMEQYQIIVPRIQRDYAQGRDGEHPSIVREKLLHDIDEAENTDPLDLGFVYGSCRSDGKNENGKKIFYPADGQQRLTTLFLIHLAAFYDDQTKDELFEGFTYDARPTTRDFFHKLVEKRSEIFSKLKKLNDAEKTKGENLTDPRKLICDASWFFDSWNYDPSVKSALTVLNDIWEKWKEPDKRKKLKMKLENTTTRPIYFHFLPLEELGREDDLYIKLNARGLKLTPFENFKAAFLGVTETICSQLYDEIRKGFDMEWSDYIWKIADDNYDKAYISFFEILFQNCGILETETNKELSKEWHYNLDYSKISDDVIKGVRNMFHFLTTNQNSMPDAIIKEILSKDVVTYRSRVMFHCVYKYLSDEPDCNLVDRNAFEEWIRIIRNLTYNTTIDNVNSYRKAIEGVNKCFANKNTLLNDMACTTQNLTIEGFDSEQIKEERQKASIMRDSTKRQNILYAENQLTYFGGQIRCVIKLADYEKGNDHSKFIEYVEKLKLLFDKDKPYDGITLRRALLSYRDYSPSIGDKGIKTLCVDNPEENTSTPSLKRLFSSCETEVSDLMNALRVPKPGTPDPQNDILRQLENIIQQNITDIPQNDWRYCLISYPGLFDKMSARYYRFFIGSDPLLIGQQKLNSNNTSIYLHALVKQLNKHQSIVITADKSTAKGTDYYERYLKIKNKYVCFSDSKYIIYDDFNESFGGVFSNDSWQSTGTPTNIIDEVENYLKTL